MAIQIVTYSEQADTIPLKENPVLREILRLGAHRDVVVDEVLAADGNFPLLTGLHVFHFHYIWLSPP